jgi:hypothetical protein
MLVRNLKTLLLAAAGILAAGTVAGGQGGPEPPVKVRATAGRPDAGGEQAVTVTLEIGPKHRAYANPAGHEDFEPMRTVVTVGGKGGPELVKVEYPPGELVENKLSGDYRAYRGRVVIKATVRRAKGHAGPLDVVVKIHPFTDRVCGRWWLIKVAVP